MHFGESSRFGGVGAGNRKGSSVRKSSIKTSQSYSRAHFRKVSFEKSETNIYEQSMNIREEKDRFLQKKLNKLLKDKIFGPIEDVKKNIRTKGNLEMIEKLKK
jgi:hypothetical protein